MTDRLERIKQVFQDFRDKVAQCRHNDTTTADIQDAYSRLHRFRDRYLHEVQSPDPTDRATVRKVFEGHNFINCGSPARFRSVANNATALVNAAQERLFKSPAAIGCTWQSAARATSARLDLRQWVLTSPAGVTRRDPTSTKENPLCFAILP
jgi:hypothetical protein